MIPINTIYNMDCLEGMKLLDDNSVDMILCDLPYGVTARNKWDIIIPFDKLWEQYERIIKDNGAIVLTATQPFASQVVMSNPKIFKYEWIWEKQQGTGHLNAKKQPLRNHEQILVFYKKQPNYHPQMWKGKPYVCKRGKLDSLNYRKQKSGIVTVSNGDRYPLTIQRFIYDGKKEHPTQKPIALFEYLIKTYTDELDLVLDNCIGCGTTAIACLKNNRKYIGMDTSKEFCNITRDRINEFIPKKGD